MKNTVVKGRLAAALCCLLALSCGRGRGGSGPAASRPAPVPAAGPASSGAAAAYYPAPAGALPVVIVPGIAGSELAGVGRPELLWPPLDPGSEEARKVRDFAGLLGLADAAMGRLERLSLEGPSAQGKVEALRAGPGRPSRSGRIGSGDAYRPLFEALARARGSDNVYFFGYDWRRDNRETAAELERYLAAVAAEHKVPRVDLVAHSMGGLVVSACLARPSSRASLRRVILVGSPLLGAGEAFRSLSQEGGPGGSIIGSGLLLPVEAASLASAEGSSVSELSQGLELEARGLMASYPAVYELLRPADARRLGALGLPAAAPSPAAAARAIAEAAAYRSGVTGRLASLYRGVELYLVVGEGRRTYEAEGRSLDGDGLVSVESATAAGLFTPRARRFALGHVELVQDRAAFEYIAGIFGK
jgi:pimeloyl-ACP methyl ester carboxylesterase